MAISYEDAKKKALKLYRKANAAADYGDVLKSVEMKTGDVVTLTLSEGTALQISEGSCTLEMN